MKWLTTPKALAVTATLFVGLLLALHLIQGPSGHPLLEIKVETVPSSAAK
jgi:hypothetical protein